MFEPLGRKLWTPFNIAMLVLVAFGVLALAFRFAFGLGRTTQLSDTYAWGLWIVFDLVWIAVAAGAFATAGLIYVFQRKDLYTLGRGAVLMGLLSYSFVTVTLIADLGLPWNFYQLALQAPEQSAMFEVSWCVGLYVTILLFEFLPVAFERWGLHRAMAIWRRWSGAYVVGAVSLFVFLLSRNVVYAAATAAIFSLLAWQFRARDHHAEPIMLAIAAVTLSTMHQSSLGSLFLLMPDMLAAQWWSPVLPISFFLSSIAAGTGLVILVEMWIAKAWRRPLRLPQLAALGQITFWALLVYLVFRLGDMAVRGQLATAFTSSFGVLFAVELVARRPRAADPARIAAPPRAPRCPAPRRRAHDRRRRLQPGERRDPRDDAEGIDAAGLAGDVHADDRRVGRVDRFDRRDDLPVRPRRAADAGAAEGTDGTRHPFMTRDAWLTRHPFLKPVADLVAAVDAAAARLAAPIAEPDWAQYLDDFHAGVPLLRAASAPTSRSPTRRELVRVDARRPAGDAAAGAVVGSLPRAARRRDVSHGTRAVPVSALVRARARSAAGRRGVQPLAGRGPLAAELLPHLR